MKSACYSLSVLALAASMIIAGCGFSADSMNSPSGEGGGLQAEGWAAGVSNLDSGPEMAFSPQIAVEGDPAGDDAQSSAIAVWVKLEDPDPFDANPQQVYRLYAARAVGAVWAAPQLIDTGSASYYSAWSPKISMDDSGNAIAVWQQSDGTAERVWTRRFTGGAWAVTDAASGCTSGGNNGADDGICRLNDSTDFDTLDAVGPAIAVEPDGGGTAMAVWSQAIQKIVDSADATTGWTSNAGSVSLNTTTFQEGTGALNLIKTNTTTADSFYYKNVTSFDITGGKVQVWLYIRDAAALAKVLRVTIYLFNGGVSCPACMFWDFAPAALSVGWNLLTADPVSPTGQNGFNPAAVDWIRMDVDTTTAATTYAAGEFIMDYWYSSSTVWKTVARGFSAGTWATSDGAGATAVCPAGSGISDGICMISGGTSLTPADSPVVAMDQTGRAIAAFIRQVATSCIAAETDTNPATSPPTVTCYDSALWVNRFDTALAPDWNGLTNIDPNAPVDSNSTATDSPVMCFQNGDANTVTGNLTGFSTACQEVSQPRITMDRAGNAMVVVKIYWQEAEAADNNASTCTAGGGGGNQCDNGNATHTAAGAPPADAYDDWNGNAIAARRFDQGTATWGGAVFLFAHSNQPSNVTNAGGSEQFYNCPAAGRAQVDPGRWLIECQLNAPQIVMGDTDNNPATNNDIALAVWERFDGTNYDVYADCFTQASLATCGGAAATDWRSSFAIPEPGTATNDSYTTPYFVLNNTATSRMAFSPQVALDSTGNGLAVWTERDGNQWRVYGMRFQAGTGFVVASRTPIDNYLSDPSCASGNCYYFNPVLSMEWLNAGNAASCPAGVSCGSAWTLMLDTELLGGALLPPVLNVRVQAHQWTPP